MDEVTRKPDPHSGHERIVPTASASRASTRVCGLLWLHKKFVAECRLEVTYLTTGRASGDVLKDSMPHTRTYFPSVVLLDICVLVFVTVHSFLQYYSSLILHGSSIHSFTTVTF